MKAGVEDMFDNLPIPIDMIKHSFFKSFTEKPSDFSKESAIFFDAKF